MPSSPTCWRSSRWLALRLRLRPRGPAGRRRSPDGQPRLHGARHAHRRERDARRRPEERRRHTLRPAPRRRRPRRGGARRARGREGGRSGSQGLRREDGGGPRRRQYQAHRHRRGRGNRDARRAQRRARRDARDARGNGRRRLRSGLHARPGGRAPEGGAAAWNGRSTPDRTPRCKASPPRPCQPSSSISSWRGGSSRISHASRSPRPRRRPARARSRPSSPDCPSSSRPAGRFSLCMGCACVVHALCIPLFHQKPENPGRALRPFRLTAP